MLSIDCRMYLQVAPQNISKLLQMALRLLRFDYLENIDMRLRRETLVTCNDLFSFHVLDEQLSNSRKKKNSTTSKALKGVAIPVRL